jgi:L-aspartate oxidase
MDSFIDFRKIQICDPGETYNKPVFRWSIFPWNRLNMSEAQNRNHFDVLIVGGGAAGLYTALSLSRTMRIALVTKDTLKQSASDWAQGGIAAAIRQDDSPTLHATDTFQAGAGLCDPAAVNLLVHHAETQIAKLLEMGVAFDRQQQELALTLEAAHSRPRVLHAADATGKALIKTLTNQVFLQSNIHVFADCFTLNLWIHAESNRCQGVSVFYQNRFIRLSAGVVVLATGGGGQVFSQTTNPPLSTGDGVAMAWRAGAVLRDLEFFQFHPTALKSPGAPRFLISEAVRGEGAYLLDHQQYRFMADYHELGELAPRDIVSQSIVAHLEKSGEKHVWLDLRSIPTQKIQQRFPKIIRVCKSWGIDIFNEPIPVAPAAHYWMGGIQTNLNAQTSIKGLYAVGEVASTGVHGANRLASNSLLECLVFGAALAQAVYDDLETARVDLSSNQTEVAVPDLNATLSWDQLAFQFKTRRQDLAELMWNSAGIRRDRDRLSHALQTVQTWRQADEQMPLSQILQTCESPKGQSLETSFDPNIVRGWGETRNLLDIASLILRSALFRTESRGGHSRTDFPQSKDEWLVHTAIRNDNMHTSKLHFD